MNKNNFWKKYFFLHLPRDLLTDVLNVQNTSLNCGRGGVSCIGVSVSYFNPGGEIPARVAIARRRSPNQHLRKSEPNETLDADDRDDL